MAEARISSAADRAGDKAELAGEKIKHKTQEAYDSAAEAGEKIKHKTQEAYDSAAEAGEKIKHKTQEAYDSATAGLYSAGEKLRHATSKERVDVEVTEEGKLARAAHTAKEKISEAAHHIKEEVEEHLPHLSKDKAKWEAGELKHAASKEKVEAEGTLAHAAHTAKEKISEAAHHVKEEVEEHLPHLRTEKAKKETINAGAAAAASAAASAALHQAKVKLEQAKDSAVESTSQAGEKVKHKAQEAWDSASGSFVSAKEKAEHAGHLMKEKLWSSEHPIEFTHPIFPGFRAWMAIFGAIGTQLFLGWLWYNFLFKNLFRKALEEDRAFKYASGETVKGMPGVEKLSDAAHSAKDKALASSMGQKLKEKVVEGKDKLMQGKEKLKGDSRVHVTASAGTTAAPVITQHVFSSTSTHVTTTTIPLASTAPIAPSATTATTDIPATTSTTASLPKPAASATSALPKPAAETNDAAEAAFLREKEKPLLTFEPSAAGGEFIEGPYSAVWGPISSLLVSIMRSFFMFHWLRVLMVHSLSGALAMACFFFIGSQFCSMHHYVWEGRPLKLLFIDQGAELAMSLAAAFVVYEFGIAH